MYKITNLINGKIYVGQTSRTLEVRFAEHTKAKSVIGKAIRKYDKNNFSIEVIEVCQSKSELNEREEFWIKELDSLIPNGYNVRARAITRSVKIKDSKWKSDFVTSTLQDKLHKAKTSISHDFALTTHFYLPSIKMTPIEKGKVISQLLEKFDGKSNQELVEKIGEEVFGLKKSMTYYCLRLYKKSEGEHTVDKPRDNNFDVGQIRDLAQGLPENLDNISADEGLKQLENIKMLEQQLNYLKKGIKNIGAVAEAITNQKKEKMKAAKEKKKP